MQSDLFSHRQVPSLSCGDRGQLSSGPSETGSKTYRWNVIFSGKAEIENPINDRMEGNERNKLSEHFVSNLTGTRRKSGFPRKLSRNAIFDCPVGRLFLRELFLWKPDKAPIADPTMPSSPDEKKYSWTW
jgi:hypothetical protein